MRFEALELSLQLIRKLRPIVAIIQTHDRKLAEQVRTAANSSSLNLAEGNRRAGKDKLHFWRISSGSTDETRASLRVAEAWGYVSSRQISETLHLADRLLAVTWRLIHPRK